MSFFRLLADFMRALLEFPKRFLIGMKAWRQQRSLMALSTRDVGREVEAASGIKTFFKRLGKVVLWILLIVLVIAFFVLLYWLNNSVLDLPRVLGGVPWLRPFWLPIVVILSIGTFWLGVRLWRLLGPEREANEWIRGRKTAHEGRDVERISDRRCAALRASSSGPLRQARAPCM